MEDNNSKIEDIFSDNNTPSEPSKKPKIFKGAYTLLTIGIVLLLVGIFVIGFFVGKGTVKDNFGSEQPIVDEVYGILKDHYIEDVSKSEFEDDFAAGFAGVLDKYTGLYYSVAPVINDVYGMTVAANEYSVKTIRTVTKSGAMNGKVQRGDIILEAKFDMNDWLDVENMRVDIFTEKVKKSRSMALKVQRGSEVVTTTAVGKQPPTSDPLAEYLDTPFDGIGYIRLDSFETGAAYDFMRALDKFTRSGNHILMLDLRDNPGGTNFELARIVRNFIAQPTAKDQVLNIKTRNGTQKTYADDYKIAVIDPVELVRREIDNSYIGTKIENNTGKKFRLILMANDNSASATEAFIGNIEHYVSPNDYLLLGESDHTFGKGIAQQDFPLKTKKGVILHVTVGKYYILGKYGTENAGIEHTIHGVGYELDNEGIIPDIKGDIFEESIIVKAVEKATAKWTE